MSPSIAQAAVLIVVLAGAGFAQSKTAAPEEVVRQFFKAEDDGRWLDAARVLDLKRFEAIRQMTLRGLRTLRPPAAITPEKMMQMDPDMPRVVAEYQAKQTSRGFQEFDLLASEFARVPSADSLERLPVDEAAARWLEAKDPRWQEERDRRRGSNRGRMECPPEVDSLKAKALNQVRPTAVILGATSGDSTRYVVVGSAFAPRPPRHQESVIDLSPNVVTLVRVTGGWKIVPTPDMVGSTGFGGNMTVSLACEIERPDRDSSRKK